MGDGLKLTKDRRHRSSSSLAGSMIEGSRSERKLDIRASIPEVDDHLAIAEARCDDLEKKIDLVKVLKRKRKLKKRSMTRVVEQPSTPENVPFITVRTQPKKKVSQQAARLRRFEVPPNPTRGYLDPATIEQHRMIGQVRGYNQNFRQPHGQEEFNIRETMQAKPSSAQPKSYSRLRPRRVHAEGDAMVGQGVQISSYGPMEVACGDDEGINDFNDFDGFEKRSEDFIYNKNVIESRNQMKTTLHRCKHVTRDRLPTKNVQKLQENASNEGQEEWTRGGVTRYRRQQAPRMTTNKHQPLATTVSQVDDRPVVELFNKNRVDALADVHLHSKTKRASVSLKAQRYDDQAIDNLDDQTPVEIKKFLFQEVRSPRRLIKYRSRRYELPTVASQMKQAGVRHFYGNANQTNIPFVVSKSTAPSHNIGVNIQQVLNGLKIQQPLSGIPLTIAHHMGLGHVPYYGTKSVTVQPSLDNREINVIKVGDRLLRLPSYKYISYNRLLSMYRQGDGMVPRFLRAINRPHYFYTSMYNSLAMNRDDIDGATSKGCGRNNEAKQSLAEYANLYREYEQIEKCMKDGNYKSDLERRKDELSKELAAREEHIRKVVQEFRGTGDVEPSTLRASASTTEDGYRNSTFKLNLGNRQQQ
ncbi:hypothetical protein K1T71_000146 [Dendrolimus kikuchii]|uniref:Uncharacterized protein n=1 Tax=Dendrolimus kikuchii TaxID=765133 RepID=A0ACC1DIC3_9NEOP|nr:hypothetical protein K1T71_000146 [Dendrolimus kikuchii]